MGVDSRGEKTEHWKEINGQMQRGQVWSNKRFGENSQGNMLDSWEIVVREFK